jgi:hypothetical protein
LSFIGAEKKKYLFRFNLPEVTHLSMGFCEAEVTQIKLFIKTIQILKSTYPESYGEYS